MDLEQKTRVEIQVFFFLKQNIIKKKGIDVFFGKKEIIQIAVCFQGGAVHYLSHTSLALLPFLSTLAGCSMEM